MDNQHKQIKGYRDLSQVEIDLMNECKAFAEQVGAFVRKVSEIGIENEGKDTEVKIDHRWLATGKTDLQKGFMSVIRSIAKPTTF